MKTQATRIEPPKPSTDPFEPVGCLLTLIISGAAIAAVYMIGMGVFL